MRTTARDWFDEEFTPNCDNQTNTVSMQTMHSLVSGIPAYGIQPSQLTESSASTEGYWVQGNAPNEADVDAVEENNLALGFDFDIDLAEIGVSPEFVTQVGQIELTIDPQDSHHASNVAGNEVENKNAQLPTVASAEPVGSGRDREREGSERREGASTGRKKLKQRGPRGLYHDKLVVREKEFTPSSIRAKIRPRTWKLVLDLRINRNLFCDPCWNRFEDHFREIYSDRSGKQSARHDFCPQCLGIFDQHFQEIWNNYRETTSRGAPPDYTRELVWIRKHLNPTSSSYRHQIRNRAWYLAIQLRSLSL